MKKIHVIYGRSPKEMTIELLTAMDPVADLKRDTLIALKPNLVVAKPASSGATTHPEIAEGVIEYLKELKFTRIAIMEGSWVGARTAQAFRVCGYEALAKKHGIGLIDLQKDSSSEFQHEGFRIRLCDRVTEVGYLINLPVMKGHCQTQMTCALKNLKGCIPDSEKSRFHSIGLHKPIAYLNKILTSHLTIVDAIMGDLTFEEGGNPVEMNRMFAGTDPVLVDAYAAQIMGLETSEVPYIGIAEKLGVGSSDLDHAEIIELNRGTGGKAVKSDRIAALSAHVREKQACSACYANLMSALAVLDDRGVLGRLTRTIHIGQGFRGFTLDEIGVGKCTQGCRHHAKGCPPEKDEIITFIGKFL